MELWYVQNYLKDFEVGLRVRETIFVGKSRFQEIAVVDTYLYGKVLLLDGIVQLSEKDEFMYHEMLVHPAMVTHPEPKRVFIIGGGDGGAAREVLKHPVEEVVMVDIDEEVIEVCRKFFPNLAPWNDPRLKVIVDDATRYITTASQFDVIIMDSTDPFPRGVAEPLFSPQFFEEVYQHLTASGVFVSQMEPPFFEEERVEKLWRYLRCFPILRLYWGMVPTYPGGVWSYIFASKKEDPVGVERNLPFPTRYYSSKIHQAAFVLPVFLEELFKR
ncbi:MAG: polyamine aminopropyltransferase [Atribacterota bacterium]